MAGKEEIGPPWLVALRAALDAIPREYTRRYQEITKIRHTFQKEIATALERPLNDFVHTMPQASLAEKRQITAMVNNNLRLLDLCLRYSTPTSSEPAILVADYRDDEEKTSRFRLAIAGPHGRQLRKNASLRVPTLELMESPPRKEAFAARLKECRGDDTLGR